ncbi:MAG TPA: hypothetical protein ENI20_05500 [Bacteroides sp.]|nr:hypothetical protein [Bacteroides sp.]
MKTVIQVALLVAIIVLGYLLWKSINKPILFNKEKDRIEAATIQRLKDIRKAQLAYKAEYKTFTGDFDTLIFFVKTDSFRVVKAIGSVPDSLIEELGRIKAERQALKDGLISRDTVRLSVKDSLFPKNYHIDSLRYVPFTDGLEFELGAGVLQTTSKVPVRVFEAKVHYDILLAKLNRQLVINYKEIRETITGYPGLRVGSLEETTNNAGNWE